MFLICEAGVTSAQCWSVFSLLMCTGNSLMVDLCLLKTESCSLFGVSRISLGQAMLLECAGALGVPWEPH